MRVIEPGHVYAVQNIDGPGEQIIRFVRRRDASADKLAEEAWEEGILCQELFRVLIHRIQYLDSEAPHPVNVEATLALRKALTGFEARAAQRTIEKLPMPERAVVCSECQHMLCTHDAPKQFMSEGDGR